MTGIQIQPSVSSVRGLPQALDSKVSKVEGKSLVDDSEIAKLATVEEGAQANPDLSGYYTKTEVDSALENKSTITHNHSLNDLTEKSYNSLTDKPTIPDTSLLVPKSTTITINGTTYDLSANRSWTVSANNSFKYGLYTLSATQTSNFAVGNHVQFNTSSGSLGGLATGSGQTNGIISLAGGKTYKITPIVYAYFSGSGYAILNVFDRTNSVILGKDITCISATYTDHAGQAPTQHIIISPSGNISIDVRFGAVQALNQIVATSTTLLIEEYGGA